MYGQFKMPNAEPQGKYCMDSQDWIKSAPGLGLGEGGNSDACQPYYGMEIYKV